jgi:hypothetical protein
MDDEENRGRIARHVLERRERGALAAELCLRGHGVRIRLQVAAGVHHHAELGEQHRQRQHMHEPTAHQFVISSNQSQPPRWSIHASAAIDKLGSSKITAV